MNIIDTLRRATEDRSRRSSDKQHAILTAHFAEAIQAKEFNGALYISVDGIPIIAADDLGTDILLAISRAREAAVSYSEKGGAR